MNLSGFREIFRQECDSRLLFSFQESGTILSLGLNIGGYVECDAGIDPALVLDGTWHHCAATFDGTFMRVYLDGREIGSLRRPGKIAFQRDVPAFIGSSGGVGEHFQGLLDEVRIYAAALSAEQVATLYRAGADVQQRLLAELEKTLGVVYVPGRSFAETLAATRKNIAGQRARLDGDLVPPVFAKLKAAFPRESETFQRSTGITPLEYMLSDDAGLNARLASRLVELMLEYRPLTEQQRKQQKPADLAAWAEADKIKARFDTLAARGQDAQYSPEWVQVMLEAGGRIQFRPYQNEPVAPYMRPETPATRNLTAAEARQALERDWLHQAGQKPTPERIRREIQWARRAGRSASSPRIRPRPISPPNLPPSRSWTSRPRRSPRPARELYFQVRAVKRADHVQKPGGRFRQGALRRHAVSARLRVAARDAPSAGLHGRAGRAACWCWRGCRPTASSRSSCRRRRCTARSGGRTSPSTPARSSSVSSRTTRSRFTSTRSTWTAPAWCSSPTGPSTTSIPIYLPDGRHIVFSTTRGHTYVRCMPPTNAFVLARCDRDGSNIYFISANNEPDYLPSVHERRPDHLHALGVHRQAALARAEALDGQPRRHAGADVLGQPERLARPASRTPAAIPGSRRVMFTGSAHHNWFAGSVGIIDPDQGFNFPHGLTKVTADVPWPECGNGPVDPVESPRYHASGHYEAYYSPYPLSEQDFLVSAERGGKFVLYLMDVDGNRELIYEGAHHIFHALPLKPRPKPPVIAGPRGLAGRGGARDARGTA